MMIPTALAMSFLTWRHKRVRQKMETGEYT